MLKCFVLALSVTAAALLVPSAATAHDATAVSASGETGSTAATRTPTTIAVTPGANTAIDSRPHSPTDTSWGG
ncbi:hypothetical protein [Streptomyces sp. G-G2]|uniref:hypothetical protein n=1 Tax=Streptomyces sp. G-G2 TaxID=3046201 RepID=UPI0024BB7A56|nr:hypothetical protein [Streptomyces sp. G-G2]MDJ0381081.1 hypothetical protein [Streptomyces sp. G-G2]